MREQEFRAWDIDKKEYISDFNISNNGVVWTQKHIDCDPEYPNCILELPTGLKDKNGEPIWEGDILQGKNNKIYEVSFSDGYTKFESNSGSYGGLLQGYIDEFEMRIIGNIHENKELLEEKNERER